MASAERRLPDQIIRTSRKTIAIQITPEGRVVVRCPISMGDAEIRNFIQGKLPWIRSHLAQVTPLPQKLTGEELDVLKKSAAQLLSQRVAHYAAQMGVSYGKITVRTQRTRWGSCNIRGDLSFNALLTLTPPEVADYVVVHELCHRRQMNHSPAFWQEVEKFLPDYPVRQAWLRKNGGRLIARLPG